PVLLGGVPGPSQPALEHLHRPQPHPAGTSIHARIFRSYVRIALRGRPVGRTAGLAGPGGPGLGHQRGPRSGPGSATAARAGARAPRPGPGTGTGPAGAWIAAARRSAG